MVQELTLYQSPDLDRVDARLTRVSRRQAPPPAKLRTRNGRSSRSSRGERAQSRQPGAKVEQSSAIDRTKARREAAGGVGVSREDAARTRRTGLDTGSQCARGRARPKEVRFALLTTGLQPMSVPRSSSGRERLSRTRCEGGEPCRGSSLPIPLIFNTGA